MKADWRIWRANNINHVRGQRRNVLARALTNGLTRGNRRVGRVRWREFRAARSSHNRGSSMNRYDLFAGPPSVSSSAYVIRETAYVHCRLTHPSPSTTHTHPTPPPTLPRVPPCPLPPPRSIVSHIQRFIPTFHSSPPDTPDPSYVYYSITNLFVDSLTERNFTFIIQRLRRTLRDIT